MLGFVRHRRAPVSSGCRALRNQADANAGIVDVPVSGLSLMRLLVSSGMRHQSAIQASRQIVLRCWAWALARPTGFCCIMAPISRTISVRQARPTSTFRADPRAHLLACFVPQNSKDRCCFTKWSGQPPRG